MNDDDLSRDLQLHAHGLKIVERRLANFLPTQDGRYLASGAGRTHAEVAKFSARDAARLDAYAEKLDAVADVLRDIVLQTPDNFSPREAIALCDAWVDGLSLVRDR